MSDSAPTLRQAPAAAAPDVSSDSPLLRLLRLTWQYRTECLEVFAYQVLLVALGLSGLSLSGLCVDVLRRALDANAPAVRWPLGVAPPAAWSTLQILFAIGA